MKCRVFVESLKMYFINLIYLSVNSLTQESILRHLNKKRMLVCDLEL